ncbi:MAG TPA: ABC transporter substrate-binding protein [Lachnospiraceae bacterium]|nr:ABC transporter substrate-binding protein [Lachnospiraceae bacterium]
MKKAVALLLCGAMAVGLLSACGSSSSGSSDTIKIGVFEPQTGENGGGGIQELQGARYANELRPTVKVGDKEYKIVLDEVDNKSDKTEAVTAAQKLVADGVKAVIGTYGSGCAIAAAPTFEDAKIPAVGVSCTNPQVTQGNTYYFRVCFLDPFQGTVMANYAWNEGYKSAAVISQLGDDYSSGLASYFSDAFTKLGGTVVDNEQFQTNQSDFKAILTNVKNGNPDFIFAPSSITTAPLIIKQARELGIKAVFGGGDTWYNTTIIDNASAAYCEGMVCSTFFDEADTSNDKTVEFVKGYKEWLNKDQTRVKNNGGNDAVVGNTALCYDTYNVICDALESAGSTDGATLRETLAKTNYTGCTGSISFDDNGDANRDSAYIDTVKDGAFSFLKIVKVGDTK